MGAQRVDVAGPVGRLAERVEQQRDLAQAERLEEAPAEGDDLDVEVRVVDAEHLDADLVELPVAAALRLLVAEVGAGVPRLPRRRRAVLDERPAHAGRLLGTQGDVATAEVGELVHLLGDDVGGLADAAGRRRCPPSAAARSARSRPARRRRRRPRRSAASGPTPAPGCRASRGWSGTRTRRARLPAPWSGPRGG